MMNEFLQRDVQPGRSGRPTPDAAWGLLSESLTGYDWHGGFYAAPSHRAAAQGSIGRGLGAWLRARRAAREVATLGPRERSDARLPLAPRQPAVHDTLWERAAAWAASRAPGGPCIGAPC